MGERCQPRRWTGEVGGLQEHVRGQAGLGAAGARPPRAPTGPLPASLSPLRLPPAAASAATAGPAPHADDATTHASAGAGSSTLDAEPEEDEIARAEEEMYQLAYEMSLADA